MNANVEHDSNKGLDKEKKDRMQNWLEPLVTFKNDEIQFNEQVARRTFASPAYQGLKTTLVSVMGPSRSGKSFLMSVLTNSNVSASISGAFQSGMQRHTEGILIFVNPIFIQENHVVFFLDTQGTFDMQTDRNVSAWIAGFSLLLSDIQIVNLVGNIGGDDLHDIHFFIETAASFRGGNLPRSLMFVIRDTPNWSDDSFLETVWAQCENSNDLKAISNSLRTRFPEEIECFCAHPASENVRRADGHVELQAADLPLMGSLLRVKEKLKEKCLNISRACEEDAILQSQKIIYYLQNEAPKLKSTVKMSQEASVAVAVNRASDSFRIGLKGTTDESLELAIMIGRVEVERTLKDLLKEPNIREAQTLLAPKIEELIHEKRQEFESLKNDKLLQKRRDEFCAKWRNNISKLERLDDAMAMKRNEKIKKEALSDGIEIAETSFQLLKNALNDQINRLKTQHVQAEMKKLNTNMFETLSKLEVKTLPSADWVNRQVNPIIRNFKNDCFKYDFSENDWRNIEIEATVLLKSTAERALNLLKLSLQTKEREETLQKELEKKAKEIREQTANAQRETRRLQELKLQEALKTKARQPEHAQRSASSNDSYHEPTTLSSKSKLSTAVDQGKEMLEFMQKQMEERNKMQKEMVRESHESDLRRAEEQKRKNEARAIEQKEKEQKIKEAQKKEDARMKVGSAGLGQASGASSKTEDAQEILGSQLQNFEMQRFNGENDAIDAIIVALKIFTQRCRNEAGCNSDELGLNELMTTECLKIARRKGVHLQESNLKFPSQLILSREQTADIKKAVIKDGGLISKPSLNVAQFEWHFKYWLNKSFAEVIVVNGDTIGRLINNSETLRNLFVDIADRQCAEATALVTVYLASQWSIFFSEKPRNPVFQEDMLHFLRHVETILRIQIDHYAKSKIGGYPRRNIQSQDHGYNRIN